jgi:hypothetical protein
MVRPGCGVQTLGGSVMGGWGGSAQRRRNMWVLVGGLAAIAVVPLLSWAASRPDRADVYAAASNAAYELRRTPVDGLIVSIFDVEDAVRAGNQSGGRFNNSVVSDLKVRSAGRDSRGDLYELTRDDGRYPVCLIVAFDPDLTSTAPPFPSVSIDDGPC